jgi:hypothetical protein
MLPWNGPPQTSPVGEPGLQHVVHPASCPLKAGSNLKHDAATTVNNFNCGAVDDATTGSDVLNMKTILFLLPLAGAVLLASAAEPVKESPASTNTTPMATPAPAAPTGHLDVSDSDYAAKLGERLARSEAITVKPLRSSGQNLLQSLNPFAPLERAPGTPWLGRTGWAGAPEKAAAKSEPAELRHAPRMGFVVCRCD